MAEPAGAGSDRPSIPRVVRVLLALVLVGACLLLARQLGAELPRLASWIEGLGALAPAVFVLVYAAAVVALVPGSILTLAAGALFGLTEGVAYVFIAAVLGSSVAFLIARTVGRGAVERRMASRPAFAAIDRAIAERGRQVVFLLRLSPVFPFSLLNYALGLTRVRFLDFLIASVGMLPGTVLYVYYGRVAGDVAALAGGARVDRGPGYYVVLILGLLATILATTLITRRARRALAGADG